MGSSRTTHYTIGSVVGPHPFPMIVRDFQSVIGRETRAQCLEQIGRLPDAVVACVGGGSNAAGMFAPFIEDAEVELIGAEAGGRGLKAGEHAASLTQGRPGVLHGSFSYVLQDDDGQTQDVHSISAGLDYPGVGPEHSYWKDIGRVRYESITDAEALDAYNATARHEGHPARARVEPRPGPGVQGSPPPRAGQGPGRLPLRPRRQGRLRGRPAPRRADLSHVLASLIAYLAPIVGGGELGFMSRVNPLADHLAADSINRLQRAARSASDAKRLMVAEPRIGRSLFFRIQRGDVLVAAYYRAAGFSPNVPINRDTRQRHMAYARRLQTSTGEPLMESDPIPLWVGPVSWTGNVPLPRTLTRRESRLLKEAIRKAELVYKHWRPELRYKTTDVTPDQIEEVTRQATWFIQHRDDLSRRKRLKHACHPRPVKVHMSDDWRREVLREELVRELSGRQLRMVHSSLRSLSRSRIRST